MYPLMMLYDGSTVPSARKVSSTAPQYIVIA